MLRIRLANVLLLFAILLVTGPARGDATTSTEGPKPNIVFFLIDDLGRSDVGFMGCRDIQTPQIDALAKAGAILDAHYVQPVCSPTRAALMTGRYATRTGVYTIVRPHAKWGLPLAERTLANALKEAGYQTAITGKWHLGEFDRAYVPTARGFDHQFGHYFGAIDYFTHTRGDAHDWYRDDKELKVAGYSTHLIAEEACRLIRAKPKGKPLFLYVPFNGVHSPLQVPDKYLAPYAKLTGNRKTLAGMLSAVDEAIGQIVTALTETGERERTLILFSADNGGPNPESLSTNGTLRAGKGTLYEGGVRVCAFANWPGRIPAGTTVSEPMHAVDWYPTLVKLAGGSLDQKLPLDGRDIWPMLTQQAKSPHDAILLVQSPQKVAVRLGDWKLHMTRGGAKSKAGTAADATEAFELYNLRDDVGEKNNLASQQSERVATLQARIEAFMKEAVPEGQIGKEPPEASTPTKKKAKKKGAN